MTNAALADLKFFEENFHIAGEVLIEGITKVAQGTPATQFPNSPLTPLFHHNPLNTTQKELLFASEQAAEFPLWNILMWEQRIAPSVE